MKNISLSLMFVKPEGFLIYIKLRLMFFITLWNLKIMISISIFPLSIKYALLFFTQVGYFSQYMYLALDIV